MSRDQMVKQMDYQMAAMEIATFQKALEEAYRSQGVMYDSTINPIVVNFAQRLMFERDINAPPETKVPTTQA